MEDVLSDACNIPQNLRSLQGKGYHFLFTRLLHNKTAISLGKISTTRTRFFIASKANHSSRTCVKNKDIVVCCATSITCVNRMRGFLLFSHVSVKVRCFVVYCV